MVTKLSKFCEGMIEAGWLAAVIVVPLFFNVFSSRIFEPDKVAILRSISLIILTFWLIKIIDQIFAQKNTDSTLKVNIRLIIKFPLFIPVVGLFFAYIIATIFSVSPSASFFGSYQRLQGTYTFISYLIIFAALVGNLRSRLQVDRILTMIVVTSFPIALYGVLQRYGIDPVPWEGDVAERIASTMGNSIFVAAYLIIAFPITVERIIKHFRVILSDEKSIISHMIQATAFVIIVIFQVFAIYLSFSRGPFMGFLVSIGFLVLFLVMILRKRWIVAGLVIIGILVVCFLMLINIENGPLEAIRNHPIVGRFGRMLDPTSNSALVRQYIWEGASELISPHEPLQFPDSSWDAFNSIRQVVGYGPESMFVAYNPFYVPQLGSVERRNASPDRAHNETWDALITTGGLGLLAYVVLFSAIFYYSLKWLGFVNHEIQKYLFIFIYIFCGLLGSIIASLWRGIPYIGIGLPFGLVFGLFLYIVLVALSGKYDKLQGSEAITRYILISVLLSSILAHFVEINFGIAIVATRTYFWVLVGLLVFVGYISSIKFNIWDEIEVDTPQPSNSSLNINKSKSKLKSRKGKKAKASNGWISEGLIPGLLSSIVLITLGYDLIGNPEQIDNVFEVLLTTFTEISRDGVFIKSAGIALMIVSTWIISGLILALGQTNQRNANASQRQSPIKIVFFVLGISLLVGAGFWFWHASGLTAIVMKSVSSLDDLFLNVAMYESILTKYYIFLFILLLVLAFVFGIVSTNKFQIEKISSLAGVIALVLVIPLMIWGVSSLNLRVIQADVVFRIASAFARPNQWPVAVEVYNRANQLAPSEDYYYLSLAGAYFEQAKTIEDPAERDKLLRKAELDLLRARELNPLNTDHTGNLARLYNLWASYADSEIVRQDRLSASSDFYQTAVTLSPKNARLWDEWALLYLTVYKQPEVGYQKLKHALEIDPEYDWTHGLLGDYYSQLSNISNSDSDRLFYLNQAANEYELAVSYVKYYEAQHKYSYLLALANVYTKLFQYDDAIDTYLVALGETKGSIQWQVEEALARLYYQQGDKENALNYARDAYLSAPEDHRGRIEELISLIDKS